MLSLHTHIHTRLALSSVELAAVNPRRRPNRIDYPPEDIVVGIDVAVSVSVCAPHHTRRQTTYRRFFDKFRIEPNALRNDRRSTHKTVARHRSTITHTLPNPYHAS
jgi:hypothetical protein